MEQEKILNPKNPATQDEILRAALSLFVHKGYFNTSLTEIACAANLLQTQEIFLYLKKKDENMRATLALKNKKQDFAHGRKNWVEPLRKWILDAKQAGFLSSSSDFAEIRSFVQKIGTNPEVRYKSARFGASAPYEFTAVRRRFWAPPSAPFFPSVPLSDDEVLICEELLAFARTFFEEQT